MQNIDKNLIKIDSLILKQLIENAERDDTGMLEEYLRQASREVLGKIMEEE